MQILFFIFFAFLCALQRVAAHGYVSQIAIDGTWYAGNVPNNYKGPSPIRLVDDIGPVKGSNNPDLMCGLSAAKAEMVVPANPGSVFSVQWSGGGGQHWPHNTGPLMTYMASCGSSSCAQFDPSGAKWFKIDQLGKKSDGSTWYQADISDSGDAYQVTLPQNLAPGGYLIRHEIIALHLATSVGGAEFYPSCTQVQIGGSGSGQPQSTVSFPGAYNDNDPGIYDPDIYNPGSNYTFPGPAISNLAASAQSMVSGAGAPPPFPSGTAVSAPAQPAQTGNGDDSGSSSPSTPTDSSDGSTPTGSGASGNDNGDPSNDDGTGSGSGSCMLKARDGTSAPNQRRHFKRFMRRMVPHSGR
ncbi:hypothetical protein BDW22DRAFT_1355695 [Trametopsis cervina]|nr:hypothetical protein BDW22DRAFT_1355695 [Trametopsis cervina]